jgi:hypothetical protein
MLFSHKKLIVDNLDCHKFDVESKAIKFDFHVFNWIRRTLILNSILVLVLLFSSEDNKPQNDLRVKLKLSRNDSSIIKSIKSRIFPNEFIKFPHLWKLKKTQTSMM